MKNTIKVTFLSCLLILFGFQIVFAQKIQSAKFTLFTENSSWKKASPVIINASIENLSDSKIELPPTIYFEILDETGENGTFYAPFSLTKTYNKDSKNCQNNLTAGNVKSSGNIVEIYPDKNLISFGGKEKKNFKIDLSGLCWAQTISSFYPSENLFTSAVTGRYTFHFEMEFDAGMKEDIRGIKYPTFVSLVSNKIEIEIK